MYGINIWLALMNLRNEPIFQVSTTMKEEVEAGY